MAFLASWLSLLTFSFFIVYGDFSDVTGCPSHGSFNTNYTFTIKKYSPCEIRYSYTLSQHGLAIRVDIFSSGATSQFPVLVVIKHQHRSLSWQIPPPVDRLNKYNSASRTFCPPWSYLDTNESVQPEIVMDTSTTSPDPIVLDTSTTSPDPVTVFVNLARKLDFQLGFNSKLGFTASPSQPQYYESSFPDNVDMLVVSVTSDDDICALVSVQQVGCSIYSLENDFAGVYQTMTQKSAITIKAKDYPGRKFYVIVVVNPTDFACTKIRLTEPVSAANRTKEFTIHVYQKEDEVILATFITVQIFVIFAIIFVCFTSSCFKTYPPIIVQQKVPREQVPLNPLNVNALLDNPEYQHIQRFFDEISAGQPSVNASQPPPPDNPPSSNEPPSPPGNSEDQNNRRTDEISAGQLSVNAPPPPDNPPNANEPPSPPGNPENQNNQRTDEISAGQPSANEPPSPPGNPEDQNNQRTDEISAGQQTVQKITIAEDDTNVAQKTPSVADLSKYSSRTLEQKWKTYLWNAVIIGVFYAPPIIQLVNNYLSVQQDPGNQDICYYNFLCIYPLGRIDDFNHLFSNFGYVFLGLIYIGIVWKMQCLHKREIAFNMQYEISRGIPRHFGFFYALGVALIMEGVISACSHVCPNHSNFKFDTAFMYVIAGLSIMTLYYARHPDITPRSFKFCVTLGIILGIAIIMEHHGNLGLWIAFFIAQLISCCLLCAQIYYIGSCCEDDDYLEQQDFRECWALPILAALVNIVFAIYGIADQPDDFASYLLYIFVVNLLVYEAYYVTMKVISGEKFYSLSTLFFVLSLFCWVPALVFFNLKSTALEESPAKSRALNRLCVGADFYDYHDLWHFLSAGALFLSFLGFLTLDNDLINVERTKIPVF